MTTLQTLILSYESLQRSRDQSDIARMIAKNGKITISFTHFMSFGKIEEPKLLASYLMFLKRDNETMPFRLLLDMDWGNYPGGVNCPLIFDISVSNDEVQKLISKIRVPVQSDQTVSVEMKTL